MKKAENKIGMCQNIIRQLIFSWSVADVKMEIPVLVQSLKSSILSSTSFQMGKTFWGVASAAVEQSVRKANMVAQRETGNLALEADPRIPPNQKKCIFSRLKCLSGCKR